MAVARRPSIARTAYLKQTLVFFDGPQVVLMQSDRGFPMVAVAVSEPDEEHYPMFVTEVSDETLRRYLRQKVDLRYLFREGSKRRYLANWAELDEQGWMRVRRADDVTHEDYFPRHGFWARHHTVEINPAVFANDRLAVFAIDGTWDASDFSRFYGKVADLYAFLSITSADASTNLSGGMTESLKEVIRSLGWRGGGSYVGFYDSVFARVDALSPLRVNRIQYASPGTIELKGSRDALADVSRVVEQFGAEGGSLKTAYSFVYDVLGREDLRTAGPDRTFSSEATRDVVLERCFEINRGLGVEAPETLLALCDGNAVVFAKITLSFFRRAKELYAFHAEGRVAPEGLEEIPTP